MLTAIAIVAVVFIFAFALAWPMGRVAALADAADALHARACRTDLGAIHE